MKMKQKWCHERNMKGKPRGMFGEIRESTGGKGEGIVEGEVVEEMRKNEG